MSQCVYHLICSGCPSQGGGECQDQLPDHIHLGERLFKLRPFPGLVSRSYFLFLVSVCDAPVSSVCMYIHLFYEELHCVFALGLAAHVG